jgi:hypothetical protein
MRGRLVSVERRERTPGRCVGAAAVHIVGVLCVRKKMRGRQVRVERRGRTPGRCVGADAVHTVGVLCVIRMKEGPHIQEVPPSLVGLGSDLALPASFLVCL